MVPRPGHPRIARAVAPEPPALAAENGRSDARLRDAAIDETLRRAMLGDAVPSETAQQAWARHWSAHLTRPPLDRIGCQDAVMIVSANGIDLYVEVHGDDGGVPVILLHGWPDSHAVWRAQVPVLAAHGFRVITPDLRGFGQSSRPKGKEHYRLRDSVADVAAILDACGVPQAHVVGHDWGSAVAWLTAIYLPDRVRTLAAISVPHPLAPVTMRQREMAWYQLYFQFEEVAEARVRYNDWAELRELTPGYKDIERAIANLSRPGALTATLNWYRANLAPRPPGPPPELPPVTVPTLGIWSDGDRYLDGPRMRASVEFVQAPWRYEEIPGATHWIPLDAPERLNELLLDWLA